MHTSIHGNTDFLSTKINIHTSPIGKIEIYGHKRQSQIPKENIFFYRSVRVHMIRNLRGLFLFINNFNFAYMDISLESSVAGIYQNVSEEN